MASHILVPVDESDHAERAFEFALEKFPDAQMTVLHVIDPAERWAFPDPRKFPSQDEFDRAIEEAAEFLEEYVDRAKAEGVDATAAHELGKPIHEIIAYADENDVDGIVMGSHGRSGPSRILLGSVAEAVTRRASVPVTIVR